MSRRKLGALTAAQPDRHDAKRGGVDRLAGYLDVLGKADGVLVVAGDYTQTSGEAAMTRLLTQAPDLDAVFVASDLTAAGVLAALRKACRRVPDDVAVAGFDDSRIAAAPHPPLTTIRQPLARISNEMVRLLLRLIDGDENSAVILPAELVIRESTQLPQRSERCVGEPSWLPSPLRPRSAR